MIEYLRFLMARSVAEMAAVDAAATRHQGIDIALAGHLEDLLAYRWLPFPLFVGTALVWLQLYAPNFPLNRVPQWLLIALPVSSCGLDAVYNHVTIALASLQEQHARRHHDASYRDACHKPVDAPVESLSRRVQVRWDLFHVWRDKLEVSLAEDDAEAVRRYALVLLPSQVAKARLRVQNPKPCRQHTQGDRPGCQALDEEEEGCRAEVPPDAASVDPDLPSAVLRPGTVSEAVPLSLPGPRQTAETPERLAYADLYELAVAYIDGGGWSLFARPRNDMPEFVHDNAQVAREESQQQDRDHNRYPVPQNAHRLAWWAFLIGRIALLLVAGALAADLLSTHTAAVRIWALQWGLATVTPLQVSVLAIVLVAVVIYAAHRAGGL